jgi:hypothetical protein
MSEELLERIDPEKRRFLKKVAVAAAFTVPVVQSFSMNGFSASTADAKSAYPPPVSPV